MSSVNRAQVSGGVWRDTDVLKLRLQTTNKSFVASVCEKFLKS